MPDLTDPDLIALGARHFASTCTMCHATPTTQRSATVRRMLPEPPRITEAAANWSPAELHWIVYNGIKMSGMPAWPGEHRADEVWAIVAYLTDMRADPENAADAAPRDGFARCTACHGERGEGSDHVPRLDILDAETMRRAIAGFDDQTRPSGIMAEALAGYDDADLEGFIARFAAFDPPAVQAKPLTALGRTGRALATAASGDPDVPACVVCHGPGRTVQTGPPIAGQPAAYLDAQLRLWRDGQRSIGPQARIMTQAAQKLDEDDIAAIAAWYAGLPPTD
jgi:cytochrome c553